MPGDTTVFKAAGVNPHIEGDASGHETDDGQSADYAERALHERLLKTYRR